MSRPREGSSRIRASAHAAWAAAARSRTAASRVESVVLGCTHYPLLKPLLARVLGPGVTLIDSAEAVAAALADTLSKEKLTAETSATPTHRFAVSDDPGRFVTVGSRFLGERLGEAELVQLSPDR